MGGSNDGFDTSRSYEVRVGTRIGQFACRRTEDQWQSHARERARCFAIADDARPAVSARTSIDSFRDDPMYTSIVRAVADILTVNKVVAPVDVIVRMGWLSTDDLEAWRFGRVAYLERLIRCNLPRLKRCRTID